MPVPVLLEATIRTVPAESESGPRRHLIEVSFGGAPVTVEHISFCNYYCSAITVSHASMTKAELQGNSRASESAWKVVVPKLTLMADPHCEVGSLRRYHR